ncbi:alpha/beta fold hydrolase [Streptomyces zhihengii]|uniref:Alpha/beta fold hydrolase n=1 Tax=Streptomyces zhihengii TaxID=1818004 RepID=A0ABS2V4F4_9ACTN|nr:alpha/beta fold hydrolase [Streptomyces zhihengii]MBM9624593.1 alpha/beta fold hydrolase [Streptomyces zhihengii]
MRSAAVNNTELAYVDEGPRDGTPIVFSHSLFFDHTMFEIHMELFAREGFRVVAYDHRNQGASAPATRESLGMDTLTEDAAALIEHLQLGRCHFVGNSMGGFVALRLAARRPDLLLSVTALGSSAEEEYQLAEFAPLADHVSVHGIGQILDTVMYIMFGDTSLSLRPELCSRWRDFMASLGPSIAESAHGVIHRTRIIEELHDCQVPVLAIAGNEDHAYPQPISGVHIAAATGGAETTVEGAGHSVAVEQPDIVAEYLRQHFVRSIKSLG